MGLKKVVLESAFRLKRSEIGDIAYRISQLYYFFFLRTGQREYLLESFIFGDAIRERGYFSNIKNETLSYSPNSNPNSQMVANSSSGASVVSEDALGLLMLRRMRYYARFIVLCLLLNKYTKVWELKEELQKLVEEYKLHLSSLLPSPSPSSLPFSTFPKTNQHSSSPSSSSSSSSLFSPQTEQWNSVLKELSLLLSALNTLSFKPSLLKSEQNQQSSHFLSAKQEAKKEGGNGGTHSRENGEIDSRENGEIDSSENGEIDLKKERVQVGQSESLKPVFLNFVQQFSQTPSKIVSSSPLYIQQAIICSNSFNQVKFSELTLEMYRILQSLGAFIFQFFFYSLLTFY